LGSPTHEKKETRVLSIPRSASLALPLIALAFAPACALRSTSTSTDAANAEDVSSTESNLESLGTSMVSTDGQSVATSADTVTTTGNVGAWYQPAGCIQATIDKTAGTATYVFDACTGPLGLVSLTGTVDVTWTMMNGSLTVNYTAQNFKINRSTIDDWQATAVVTASGNARHMTWSATLDGTTARGRTFTRTNHKVIDWTVDQPCITVSGSSEGTVSGVDLKATIDSFSRCAGECPQSGSEITVTNVTDGDTLDIKYGGGPEAELTINGRSSQISLACGL
jgi:hypothetical protein